jgi:hypothetical protein
VRQVVIIGDARANRPDEVVSKRAGFGAGESFWAKTRFAAPAGFGRETERLAAAGVLVDTFYLGSNADAAANFEWMAAQTKGTAYKVNICTPAGASELIDGVTPR